MGNIIPAIVLAIMFSSIVFYIFKAFKTNGTTCTSCSGCSIGKKNNNHQSKQDMLRYYKNLN